MDQPLRIIKIDARPDHLESALLDPALLSLLREGWRPMPVPLVLEMGNPDAGDSRPKLFLILCPPLRHLNEIRVVPEAEARAVDPQPRPRPAEPVPQTLPRPRPPMPWEWRAGLAVLIIMPLLTSIGFSLFVVGWIVWGS